MKNFDCDETQKLIVEFHKVQYGIMDFTVTLGDKSFETNFSEAFDPIILFKNWLEAICIGVYQCSFWYDPEGTEIKFNFERDWRDNNVFTVSYCYDESQVFLTGKVKRRQLVEAFYVGLLDFRNSSRFDEDGWEKHFLWEQETKNRGISYEDLIAQFLTFNRFDLMKELFDVFPCYRNQVISIGDDDDDSFEILTDEAGNEKLERIEWDVPEDYDAFTNEDKQKFIKKCFQMEMGSLSGTKIADFKSEIIEKFLLLT